MIVTQGSGRPRPQPCLQIHGRINSGDTVSTVTRRTLKLAEPCALFLACVPPSHTQCEQRRKRAIALVTTHRLCRKDTIMASSSTFRLVNVFESPGLARRPEDALAAAARQVSFHLKSIVTALNDSSADPRSDAGGAALLLDVLASYYTRTTPVVHEVPFCVALSHATFLHHMQLNRIAMADVLCYVELIDRALEQLDNAEATHRRHRHPLRQDDAAANPALVTKENHPFFSRVVLGTIFGYGDDHHHRSASGHHSPPNGPTQPASPFVVPAHRILFLPTNVFSAFSQLGVALVHRSFAVHQRLADAVLPLGANDSDDEVDDAGPDRRHRRHAAGGRESGPARTLRSQQAAGASHAMLPATFIDEWRSDIHHFSDAPSPLVALRSQQLVLRTRQTLLTEAEENAQMLQNLAELQVVLAARPLKLTAEAVSLMLDRLAARVPDPQNTTSSQRALIVASADFFLGFPAPARKVFAEELLYPALLHADTQLLFGPAETRLHLCRRLLRLISGGTSPRCPFYLCLCALMQSFFDDASVGAAALVTMMEQRMPQGAYVFASLCLDRNIAPERYGDIVLRMGRGLALALSEVTGWDHDPVATLIHGNAGLAYKVLYSLRGIARKCTTTAGSTGRTAAILEALRAALPATALSALGHFVDHAFSEMAVSDTTIPPRLLVAELAMVLHGEHIVDGVSALKKYCDDLTIECAKCGGKRGAHALCPADGAPHAVEETRVSTARLLQTLASECVVVARDVTAELSGLLRTAPLSQATYAMVLGVLQHSMTHRVAVYSVLEPHLGYAIGAVTDAAAELINDARLRGTSSFARTSPAALARKRLQAEDICSALISHGRIVAMMRRHAPSLSLDAPGGGGIARHTHRLVTSLLHMPLVDPTGHSAPFAPASPTTANNPLESDALAHVCLAVWFTANWLLRHSGFNLMELHPTGVPKDASSKRAASTTQRTLGRRGTAVGTALEPLTPASLAHLALPAASALVVLRVLHMCHLSHAALRRLVGVCATRLIMDFNLQAPSIVEQLLLPFGSIACRDEDAVSSLALPVDEHSRFWSFVKRQISADSTEGPFKLALTVTLAQSVAAQIESCGVEETLRLSDGSNAAAPSFAGSYLYAATVQAMDGSASLRSLMLDMVCQFAGDHHHTVTTPGRFVILALLAERLVAPALFGHGGDVALHHSPAAAARRQRVSLLLASKGDEARRDSEAAAASLTAAIRLCAGAISRKLTRLARAVSRDDPEFACLTDSLASNFSALKTVATSGALPPSPVAAAAQGQPANTTASRFPESIDVDEVRVSSMSRFGDDDEGAADDTDGHQLYDGDNDGPNHPEVAAVSTVVPPVVLAPVNPAVAPAATAPMAPRQPAAVAEVVSAKSMVPPSRGWILPYNANDEDVGSDEDHSATMDADDGEGDLAAYHHPTLTRRYYDVPRNQERGAAVAATLVVTNSRPSSPLAEPHHKSIDRRADDRDSVAALPPAGQPVSQREPNAIQRAVARSQSAARPREPSSDRSLPRRDVRGGSRVSPMRPSPRQAVTALSPSIRVAPSIASRSQPVEDRRSMSRRRDFFNEVLAVGGPIHTLGHVGRAASREAKPSTNQSEDIWNLLRQQNVSSVIRELRELEHQHQHVAALGDAPRSPRSRPAVAPPFADGPLFPDDANAEAARYQPQRRSRSGNQVDAPLTPRAPFSPRLQNAEQMERNGTDDTAGPAGRAGSWWRRQGGASFRQENIGVMTSPRRSKAQRLSVSHAYGSDAASSDAARHTALQEVRQLLRDIEAPLDDPLLVTRRHAASLTRRGDSVSGAWRQQTMQDGHVDDDSAAAFNRMSAHLV